MTRTHSYALLQVSADAYDEIRALLEHAGYRDQINEAGEVDMHGIALTRGEPLKDTD